MPNDLDIDDMDADELRELVRERGLGRSAAEVYGPETAGGGGSPSGGRTDRGGDPIAADEAFLDQFEERFNAREAMRPDEYRRYVASRLGRQAVAAMAETGKGPTKDAWRGHAAKLRRT